LSNKETVCKNQI